MDKDYFLVNFTVFHRSSIVASSDQYFDEGTTDEEIQAEYLAYEREVISNINGGWERV